VITPVAGHAQSTCDFIEAQFNPNPDEEKGEGYGFDKGPSGAPDVDAQRAIERAEEACKNDIKPNPANETFVKQCKALECVSCRYRKENAGQTMDVSLKQSKTGRNGPICYDCKYERAAGNPRQYIVNYKCDFTKTVPCPGNIDQRPGVHAFAKCSNIVRHHCDDLGSRKAACAPDATSQTLNQVADAISEIVPEEILPGFLAAIELNIEASGDSNRLLSTATNP
jgi:hypothetical protein